MNDIRLKLEEIYKKFCAPFPVEALSEYTRKGKAGSFSLTSIKAHYIVERLNTLLTVAGWEIRGEWKEVAGNEGVLFFGELILNYRFIGIELEQKIQAIGYAEFVKGRSDAYKGARTDAFSKAASYLGIGNEVFKGNVKAKNGQFFPPAEFQPHELTAPKVSGPEAMVGAFEAMGISYFAIQDKMQCAIEDLSEPQVVELRKIYADIRSGKLTKEQVFKHD